MTMEACTYEERIGLHRLAFLESWDKGGHIIKMIPRGNRTEVRGTARGLQSIYISQQKHRSEFVGSLLDLLFFLLVSQPLNLKACPVQ